MSRYSQIYVQIYSQTNKNQTGKGFYNADVIRNMIEVGWGMTLMQSLPTKIRQMKN